MSDIQLLEIALLVGLLLGALLWTASFAWRMRARARRLAAAQRAEAAARRQAVHRAGALAEALDAGGEAVLVADAGFGVLHWTPSFAALSGLPGTATPHGATLADVLRLSAEAGEFGLVDVEEEVARQLALVAQGPGAFPQRRDRPDGTAVRVTLAALPGGGIMLRCAAEPAAPPVPAPAAPARGDAPAADPSFPPRFARRHVLLVEDMKVNQLVTATLLRREGHRVDVADSGEDAMRLAARVPYDLVLMDLMMPGMDGYEAARRIRALPGPAGTAPVYALTANSGEEDRARCLAAGMQGMLSKPVPAAALREALQQPRLARLLPALAAPPPTSPPVPMPAQAPLAQVPMSETPQFETPQSETLLSQARLAELRQDLPAATLASLFRLCLDDMATRLDGLGGALAGGEAGAIEREAHGLAGMAASYGLAAVERSARAVMALARRHDVPAARAAGQDLPGVFERSRAALLAWLPGG